MRPSCGIGQLYIGLSSIQHVRCFDEKAYTCSPQFFGGDVRHGLCFELLAAVGCGLFPGSNDSSFANCDSEEGYDLQPRRIVVPVLTRKLDNARALSLLYTCRSSPRFLGCLCSSCQQLRTRDGVLNLVLYCTSNQAKEVRFGMCTKD